MSQARVFCSPHLGLRNAGKCSPSPPSATAIRTWGFFCYFFMAVCWVCVWFKNVWQSEALLRVLSPAQKFHQSLPLQLPLTEYAARKLLFSWDFSLFPWLFLYKEWKSGQFIPIKNSITNYTLFPHGKKTYLCLLKRLQTEKTPNFQRDTWR